MRAGQIFLILLLILVGFGYLLSEAIHMYEELSITRNKVADLEEELKVIEDQYRTSATENEQLKVQLGELIYEKQQLQTQIDNLQFENSFLRGQNIQLKWENEQIATSSPVLAYVVRMGSANMNLAMFIPLLPFLAGITIVVTRRLTMWSHYQSQIKASNNRRIRYLGLLGR